MKRSLHAYKTRLLLSAGALFVICLAAAPAGAQTSNESAQLLSRIKQLENQVQTMSRAVYRGDKSAVPDDMQPSGDANPSAAANFEVRMSQIEDQQRTMTGQIEKITFDLQQLKTHVERMQADNEQRFQQTAQGGVNGGAAPPQPASAPVAAPPPEANQLGTISTAKNGSAEAMYEAAFANIRDTKYDQAETGFKQFISQYPNHPLASNAQYWLGETYYVRGDFKQAAKTFAQGYQNFPKSSKASDSLLKLGLSLSKLGKKDDACLSLRQLQKEVADEANPLRRRAAQEIKQLGCS